MKLYVGDDLHANNNFLALVDLKGKRVDQKKLPAVRELLRVKQEVFMPLVPRVGEGQVGFGYALAKVSGVLREVGFFVMVLPYSDAFLVMAFERECTESYWEGHARAVESFGGVPVRISYETCQDIPEQLTQSDKAMFAELEKDEKKGELAIFLRFALSAILIGYS
jgi:hypothetical protein